MNKIIIVVCLGILLGCGGRHMGNSAATHLMFYGDAEKALDLYCKVFPESNLEIVGRYGEDAPEFNGKIKQARWELFGQNFIVIDSPPVHDFGFTPAMSIFVTMQDDGEFEEVYQSLSQGGEVFMPPDNYGFSTKFAWVKDRFGVSWQINID